MRKTDPISLALVRWSPTFPTKSYKGSSDRQGTVRDQRRKRGQTSGRRSEHDLCTFLGCCDKSISTLLRRLKETGIDARAAGVSAFRLRFTGEQGSGPDKLDLDPGLGLGWLGTRARIVRRHHK